MLNDCSDYFQNHHQQQQQKSPDGCVCACEGEEEEEGTPSVKFQGTSHSPKQITFIHTQIFRFIYM